MECKHPENTKGKYLERRKAPELGVRVKVGEWRYFFADHSVVTWYVYDTLLFHIYDVMI